MSVRAVWKGTVIAEADHTVKLEGNDYFPPEALDRQYVLDSATKTLCPWKGMASYYTLSVGDDVNVDAAWYYPRPSILARRIKNHVAFWNGVRIEHVTDPEAAPAAAGGRGGWWRRKPAGRTR